MAVPNRIVHDIPVQFFPVIRICHPAILDGVVDDAFT